MTKLEADMDELEAEGAKADAKRKVKEGAERELKPASATACSARSTASTEVWDRFKNLKVQDLEGDEMLYREMT